VTLNRQLRYCEHDRQPLLHGLNDPSGHLRGGVPVVGADRAPAEVAAAAAGLVAHQFVDHPGGDAGVLQPGRVGVAEVVGAVQLDRVQQGVLGDWQRRPLAGQLVLVVVVDCGQAGGVQLAMAAATVAGRIGRPAAVSWAARSRSCPIWLWEQGVALTTQLSNYHKLHNSEQNDERSP
jgi:hypothetical protein